jgi:hypothetical protein
METVRRDITLGANAGSLGGRNLLLRYEGREHRIETRLRIIRGKQHKGVADGHTPLRLDGPFNGKHWEGEAADHPIWPRATFTLRVRGSR